MRTISIFLFILCCLALPPIAQAQEKANDEIKTGPNASPKLPADACFYATVHVKEIVTMPELKLLPWEIVSAAGIDNWGFDPLLIDRVDVILGVNESIERPVRYTIVARTSKAIKVTDIKKEAIEPLLQFNPSIVHLNERFLLVGDLDYIKRVVNEPATDGELKRQIARIGDSSLAWFALVTAPIQKQIDELVQQADEKSREDFAVILKKTKLLAARFDLQSQSVPVVLEAGSEADAIAIEATIKKLSAKMAEDETTRVETAAANVPKRVGDAMIQFKNRFLEEFQKVGIPARKGARLTTTLNQDYYEISQMGSNLSIIIAAINAMQQGGQ